MNAKGDTFYHVTRNNGLQIGQTLSLQPPQFGVKHSPEIRALADELFSEGISLHGQQYFLSSDLLVPGAISTSQMNQFGQPVFDLRSVPEYSTVDDLILELVRRCEFPNRPSRMLSFFAWPDEPTARRFATRYRPGSYRVFIVKGSSEYYTDMSWTKLGHSAVEAWYNARQYWNGATLEGQLWEHFLAFPVEIIAEIQ